MSFLVQNPDGTWQQAQTPLPEPNPALVELKALMASLPGYETITDSQFSAALLGARMPDSFGLWPSDEGYEATYDVYYAAMSLLGHLQGLTVVRQTSSEGTSISVDKPDWTALRSYYASMSPIAQASGGNGLFTEVAINNRHVRHTDMRIGGGAYGIDTDLG